MRTFLNAVLGGLAAALGSLLVNYFFFNNRSLAFSTSEVSSAVTLAVLGFLAVLLRSRKPKNGTVV